MMSVVQLLCYLFVVHVGVLVLSVGGVFVIQNSIESLLKIDLGYRASSLLDRCPPLRINGVSC